MIDDNVNKKGEIILCKDIKMDKNNENVLSYGQADLVSLCDSHKIYRGSDYSFMGDNDTINVEVPYKDAMYCNYVAFKNPKYGNKWIFGFVTDVKLISPRVTEITWEKDVWSTWFEVFYYGKAFVEREHVSDDTAGNHTLPEGLETGEYVVNYENKKKELTALNVIMASNVDPVLSGGSLVGGDVGGGIYNDIRTGFKYYHFANDTTSSLPNVLKAFSEAGKADSIISLFVAPFSSFEKADNTVLDNGQVKESTTKKTLVWVNSSAGDTYPTKLASLDGYTPVNKKLLTFPYCYLRLTNNNGNDAIYHFEKFAPAYSGDNLCRFSIDCAITPGMSIIAYPKNYDGIENNYNQCLQAGKYPICGWSNDAYTNWLTQNGVNIATSLVSSGLQVIGGAAMAGSGIGSGYLGMASGVNNIASTLGQIYEHSLTPMEAKGNQNTGDVKVASDINTFTAYGMSIKREYAEVIDKYFSRFGYKVNLVKKPNIKTRTQFNFVKVGGSDNLVTGNIPASDLEKINSIFRKGVTIFHNYSTFGDYTVSNPVRS